MPALESNAPLRYLATRRFMADPYPVLAGLRATTPAERVEIGGFRMWVVTRYADVRRILADHAIHKDLVTHRRTVARQSLVRPEHRARLAHESRRSLLDRDGADHRRLRGILAGEFTAIRIAALRPTVEAIATDLADRLPRAEPVDIVARYAQPLATAVLANLLGLPPGEHRFPDWTHAMLTGGSVAEVEEGARRLAEFAARMVTAKRRTPGDDLYTRLLRGHDVDQALDADELVSTFEVLLVGGSEPATAIGSGLLHLLARPDLLATVRSTPDLMGRCVAETLRFESPFRLLGPRFSACPVVLDDVVVPAHDLIAVSPGAANRDPARFPDPDRFDIGRDTGGHLGFGHGPHRCIGAELGRLVTEIALSTFTQRFPHARLTAPADCAQWRGGAFMRRLAVLPVLLN